MTYRLLSPGGGWVGGDKREGGRAKKKNSVRKLHSPEWFFEKIAQPSAIII